MLNKPILLYIVLCDSIYLFLKGNVLCLYEFHWVGWRGLVTFVPHVRLPFNPNTLLIYLNI